MLLRELSEAARSAPAPRSWRPCSAGTSLLLVRLLERLWAPGTAAARDARSALLPSAREAGRLPDKPLLLRLLLRLLLLQQAKFVGGSC